MAEICYNQSDWDYRREEGVNQSSLKRILESPAHYQAALKNRLIPTTAMEIGTAVHCLTLDGQKVFDAQYVKKPDGIKLNTKDGREWKETVGRKKALAAGGKDDPWGSVHGMDASLKRLAWFDPSQDEFIEHNEVSIYWGWHGVKCKARLDRVLVDEGIVLDLKTTDSVDPETFMKKVVNLGYDFQAAYYAKAAEFAYEKPFRFIFVAVERKAPYTVDLFEVTPTMMEEGVRKCNLALMRYAECAMVGEWPNRDPQIHSLEYPTWYKSPVPAIVEEPTEDVF